jgi:hypothetical protein
MEPPSVRYKCCQLRERGLVLEIAFSATCDDTARELRKRGEKQIL